MAADKDKVMGLSGIALRYDRAMGVPDKGTTTATFSLLVQIHEDESSLEVMLLQNLIHAILHVQRPPVETIDSPISRRPDIDDKAKD